jgi:hypothetical protein
MDRARHHLNEAGAMRTNLWTTERAKDDDPSPAWPEAPTDDSANIDIAKVLGVVTEVLCKRQSAHENLMDLAHDCLKALTDGRVCEQAAKIGVRHSGETMEHFNASHRHLVAAGSVCDATDVHDVRPAAQVAPETDARATAVSKALPGRMVEEATLTKVLGEVVPMLERLAKRVDEIARTPLPPLTVAKGTVSVSKEQDRERKVGDWRA